MQKTTGVATVINDRVSVAQRRKLYTSDYLCIPGAGVYAQMYLNNPAVNKTTLRILDITLKVAVQDWFYFGCATDTGGSQYSTAKACWGGDADGLTTCWDGKNATPTVMQNFQQFQSVAGISSFLQNVNWLIPPGYNFWWRFASAQIAVAGMVNYEEIRS